MSVASCRSAAAAVPFAALLLVAGCSGERSSSQTSSASHVSEGTEASSETSAIAAPNAKSTPDPPDFPAGVVATVEPAPQGSVRPGCRPYVSLYRDSTIPVIEAIMTGADDITELLAGLDLQEIDQYTRTPLLAAIHTCSLRHVAEILDAGADPNFVPSENHDPPISEAINARSAPMVRLLLQAGADPDLGGYLGWVPAFYAIGAADPEILRLLLDHGADPDGYPRPLAVALDDGWQEGVQMLDDAGASWDADVLVELATYCASGAFERVLARGADPHQPAGDLMESALETARQRSELGCQQIVQLLS